MAGQKENNCKAFCCELRCLGFKEVVERASLKSHQNRFLVREENGLGGVSSMQLALLDDKLSGRGTGWFSQLVGPIAGLIDGVDVLNRPPTRRVQDL